MHQAHADRPETPRLPLRTRFAFTLIELLVVIAIIALLVGILLPALAKARESSRQNACLSNTRQVSLAMSLYANTYKDWYPVKSVPTGQDPFGIAQDAQGGFAGYFSLYQLGDQATDPAATDIGFAPAVATARKYFDGNTVPLMEGFLDGFGSLVCPSDKLDYHFGGRYAVGPTLLSANPPAHVPKPVTNVEAVIAYNISYLYIVGFKSVETQLPAAAPLLGDESNAYDRAQAAWNGDPQDASFLGIAPNSWAENDNHGKRGGNYAFTDGHAEWIKGNAAATFFTGNGVNNNQNPKNVNVINPNRSAKLRTID